VPQNVLEALGSIPHGASPVPSMIFPAVCMGLLVLWWAWPRTADS
jgi:hypothetical protein